VEYTGAPGIEAKVQLPELLTTAPLPSRQWYSLDRITPDR